MDTGGERMTTTSDIELIRVNLTNIKNAFNLYSEKIELALERLEQEKHD